ncbi:unnamed protein product [Diamesa serratosioi]
MFNCAYGKIDWKHYTTEAISNVVGPFIHMNSLCHEDLCCEFEVNGSVSENFVNPKSYYRYRLAVYNGNKTFPGFADKAIVACSLLACASDDTSKCNTHMDDFKSIHTFTGLMITGKFPMNGKKYFRKHTDTNFKELQVIKQNYIFLDEEQDKGKYLKIYNAYTGEFNDLMTYGIFGTSTPSSPTYEAGVVEFAYNPDQTISAAQRTASNLKQYQDVMNTASVTLDIIVFPESCLNEFDTAVEIPDPKSNVIPCDSAAYPEGNLLKTLSCAAKSKQRYLVINLTEKSKCPDEQMIINKDPRDCAARPDGMSYYNVNIAFDRKGAVISRYRKFNLFGERVDKPHAPEAVAFETDFGVTFGHFICFDLMFQKPALELVRVMNITDIIFPSMWFSEMPFLSAVQVQQNWAFKNRVNLLAAGASNPKVGSTGTGIYAAHYGSLTSTMSGISETKLYTSIVPKRTSSITSFDHSAVKHTPLEMKDLYLKRDQLDRYTTVPLMTSSAVGPNKITKNICNDGLCCDFDISYQYSINARNPDLYYRYRLAVYNNNRTFDGFADGGVVACAIFACSTDDISSCAVRKDETENTIIFTSIHITGTFPYDNQYFIIPSTLDTSIMPLSPHQFTYMESTTFTKNKQDFRNITITSSGDFTNLLSFGIYGRNFNLDDNDDNSVGTVTLSAFVLALGVLLNLVR